MQFADVVRACVYLDYESHKAAGHEVPDPDEDVIQQVVEFYEDSLEGGTVPDEWWTPACYRLLYDYMLYMKLEKDMQEEEDLNEALVVDPGSYAPAVAYQSPFKQSTPRAIFAGDPDADSIMAQWDREAQENCTHGDGCPVHPNIHQLHTFSGGLENS